jgi:hypothetical protein
MAGRVTPHVLLAGSAALIALIATTPTLLFGGGSWPITTDKQRILGAAAECEVVEAKRAFEPLVPELSHPPDVDPFNPRAPSVLTGLSPPPPPPLAPPPLPVLPAPVR